ncbi:MAG: hypothetical protein HKP13_04135, partial [Gammaproteobacteria bacterium]|nr:hypothetical protein [Gammaproteobacteria bacterium]
MRSIIHNIVTCLVLCAAGIHVTHGEELVGSIPGQLTVEQGAAVYTIPIQVPSGVAGMQPDLAITYNSNAGNGLLGVGFSLSGFSVITRCGKTIAQDGVKGGVYHDDRDRFCIDGQRLIAISGSDGGDGTEYRTEIDGYSRIVSHGQQGSGPEWWQLQTKSGQVMEYGNTDDSRIEAQGKDTVRLWAVNRISDTVGNGIDFSYYEDNANGEYYPTRIEYGGDLIQFEYEQRSDDINRYVVGSHIIVSNRLREIQAFGTGEFYRKYRFAYDTSIKTHLSRLIEVKECYKDHCKNPVIFNWGDSNNPEFNDAKSIVNNDGMTTLHWSGQRRNIIAGDFNGDGMTDLLLQNKSDSYSDAYLLLADGTGGFEQYKDISNLYGMNTFGWSGQRRNIIAGDFNGDGMTDLLLQNRSDNYTDVYLLLANGTGDFEQYKDISNLYGMDKTRWSGQRRNIIAGDFNGDGMTDLLLQNKSDSYSDAYLLLADGTGGFEQYK